MVQKARILVNSERIKSTHHVLVYGQEFCSLKNWD